MKSKPKETYIYATVAIAAIIGLIVFLTAL